MEIIALAFMVGFCVLICLITGVFATRKGYRFLPWFFVGGIIALVDLGWRGIIGHYGNARVVDENLEVSEFVFGFSTCHFHWGGVSRIDEQKMGVSATILGLEQPFVYSETLSCKNTSSNSEYEVLRVAPFSPSCAVRLRVRRS